MGNIKLILAAIVALLPILVEAIKAVETAVPEGGQGQRKLELVRAWLEAAFTAAGELNVTFAQIWPALSATVTSLVTIYNSLGAFRKAAQ